MTTKTIPLSQLLDDDARAALVAGLGKIRQTVLEQGAAIRIPGVGTFRRRDLPERQVRNPATGAMMTAEASVTLTFRPARVGK